MRRLVPAPGGLRDVGVYLCVFCAWLGLRGRGFGSSFVVGSCRGHNIR